jgi:hypothetical protein
MKQIFKALEEDARLTPKQIAQMTEIPVAKVEKTGRHRSYHFKIQNGN